MESDKFMPGFQSILRSSTSHGMNISARISKNLREWLKLDLVKLLAILEASLGENG
jgi:hypothetical protein